MPGLLSHIDLAIEAASAVDKSVINRNFGPFILGCCAPDIRIITHGLREDTHFAPITNRVVGTGMKNLLKAQPGLANLASLSGATQAFMAGYFFHLVTDEAWIAQVYLPYFDDRHLFGDEVVANICDRAVQLEMDRQALLKHGGLKSIRNQLTNAHVDVEVGFLSMRVLADWSDWVIGYTQQEFTWDRLKRLAKRQYPKDDTAAQKVADDFLSNMPYSLKRVYDLVPKKVLQSYRAGTVESWTKMVQEYLP
jgi:hypothetical protein